MIESSDRCFVQGERISTTGRRIVGSERTFLSGSGGEGVYFALATGLYPPYREL